MPETPRLFNPHHIRTLAQNLGSAADAYQFLTDYFDLLPVRVQRLQAAIEDENAEAAMDAVLSLKITSAMAGAVDLESRCTATQSCIGGLRFETARAETQKLGTTAATLATQAATIKATAKADVGLDES